MLAAHGVTHAGTVRPHNEDAILVDAAHGLFVVADGMGGVSAGEVASQIAIETIGQYLVRTVPRDRAAFAFDADERNRRQSNRVETAVRLANRRVNRAGTANPDYSGMGTTVAVVLADEWNAFICGVGDSRVYSTYDGRATQLTTDHTWVEAIRTQDPTIDPVALARHPMRHVLTAVVGGQKAIDAAVTRHMIAQQERIVICSDGVYRGVSDDLLAQLAGGGSVKEAAEAILAAALERDGRDNISVIVIERS